MGYFKELHTKEYFKNKPFTVDEDQQIIDAINKHGRDWNKIALEIPHRNKMMLKNRYYYLNKKNIIDKVKNDWVLGKGIYGNEDLEQYESKK